VSSAWGPELVDPGIRNPIPHAVNKSASPQPNPLAVLRETMARLTVNLVCSSRSSGAFYFLAVAVVRFPKPKKVCASRICWRYLVSRSVLPAPIPGYHATYSSPVPPPFRSGGRSQAGLRRKSKLLFFFLRNLYQRQGGVLSRMEHRFL
jgi:hypothetical protein